MAFRAIGWSGVRFSIPDNWELSRIGLRYLFFESQAGPAMELKWGPAGKRYAIDRQLRRLSKERKNAGQTPVREHPMPAAWKTAAAPFLSACFSWKGPSLKGTGLVLHCLSCGTVSLLQFFGGGAEDTHATRVLSSFRDHPSGGGAFWSVFDISAVTPASYRLNRYRFEAGRFRLDFVAAGQRVSLYRWAPAEVLLRERSMEAFAAGVYRLPEVAPEPLGIQGRIGHRWVFPDIAHGRLGIVNRIRPGYRHKCFMIWHEQRQNRVLGIVREGKKPADIGEMERLCRDYASLS